MSKTQLSFNILVLGLLFAALAILTHFAQPIRETINKPRELVAGISDARVNDLQQSNFPKLLLNDAQQQGEILKDQAMHVSLSEIVSFIGRGKKIAQDADAIRSSVESFIKDLR